MQTSSRVAVGVHMLTLLDHEQGRRLTSEHIAASVHTNPVVIRRIGAMLARAGLVVSRLGTGGGFRLARPVDRISVLDVYRAVEIGGLFAQRERANLRCPVGRHVQAALAGHLERAERALEHALGEVTIADIARAVARLAAR
jgi:Rrf2 family protein